MKKPNEPPDPPTDNPFSKLAALRAQLPSAPVTTAAAPTTPVDPRARAFRQKIVVRMERKGRGGKTVTVVQGVQLDDEALTTLAREMKRALGCGSSIDGDVIVLQGDLVERAARWLEANGATRVVRGT